MRLGSNFQEMRLGSIIQRIGCVWSIFGSMLSLFPLNNICKINPDFLFYWWLFFMHPGFIIIMWGFRANRVFVDGQKYTFRDIIGVFKYFSIPQRLLTISCFLSFVFPLMTIAKGNSILILLCCLLMPLYLSLLLIAAVMALKNFRKSSIVKIHSEENKTINSTTIDKPQIKEKCSVCSNTFDKFKKKSNDVETKSVKRKQFDRDAFAMDHKSVIASHLPKDIEDTDTQKYLLENLNQVLPMGLMGLLLHELSSQKTAVEAGALNKNVAIGMNAQKVDRMLKVYNMDVLAANLSSNTDDQLINAYILLDFYAFVLKPEASEGVREARAYIGVELDKRLPKDASSNQVPVNNGVPNNSGKYTDGIDYVLQYRPDDDIYYVEIHDLTGKYLADVDWFPGKVGYATFVLTEDEYNLKMVHNDDVKFNELVGKLLVNLPKDRFIGAGSVVVGSNERGDLRLEMKNETMDEGTYQKYKNKKAISYIKSIDKVYITFMRATGDQIPSVDGFGYAWLFSKQEYADMIIQKNPGVDMFCKEFDQDSLSAFVKTWYRFGISRFKLNPGTNDRFAEVDRDDFLPIEGIKKWNIIGSSLNQLIIRFKQNNAIQNNPMAHATAMTMWSSICHELYRSVFLVPVTYDDEPYYVEDWVIHTSLAGAERLTQAEIERQIGDRTKDGSKLVAEDKNGNPIYMLKEDLIYGGEKYHFAKDGEVSPGRIMHLRTILNNGTTFLCGFTDFEALHKVFGENVRVAVQSYEEIIAHMNDAVSDSTAIQGFVINPGTNELMLSRENIEYVAKEKDEPGKIYTAEDKKES